jgi:uncharacterized protein (DUF488 family)
VTALAYTVGHSNRTLLQFKELLGEFEIQMVADVRAFPRSRSNPQFNVDVLPASLAESGIGYQHIAELGGRRHRAAGAPPSPNTFWTNQSFRNYADYATTEGFHVGMTRLLELIGLHRCAIMCSESLWWRCHRRIISDYLLVRGIEVLHIMGPHQLSNAELTASARPLADGKLLYPAQ